MIPKRNEVSHRWNLKGEWGFTLQDGATGIPYMGLPSGTSGSESNAAPHLTMGWRLLSTPGDWDMELDLKAIRRESNHGIGAELKLRW